MAVHITYCPPIRLRFANVSTGMAGLRRGRRRRLPDQQRRREYFFAFGGLRRIIDLAHEQGGRRASKLPAGPVYRGEKWVGMVSTFDVSGTHDGDIARDAKPGIPARVDCA